MVSRDFEKIYCTFGVWYCETYCRTVYVGQFVSYKLGSIFYFWNLYLCCQMVQNSLVHMNLAPFCTSPYDRDAARWFNCSWLFLCQMLNVELTRKVCSYFDMTLKPVNSLPSCIALFYEFEEKCLTTYIVLRLQSSTMKQ